MAFIKEEEFDKKLAEISAAYEKVKDALNVDSFRDPKTFEALQKLRDYAATGLKEGYSIKDN